MTGPPLWVVERDDAKVYLFGVRPIAGEGTWFTPDVEAALGECHAFWCETPSATEFASHPLLAELGLSPDVELRDRLDPATNERLERISRAIGLDTAGLQAVRPWIAGQIVRHATYATLYAGPTMDDILREIAIRDGKSVHTEFAAEDVIRVFGQLPPDVEADMLRFELDSLEPGAEKLRERYARGLAGDLSLDEAEAVHVATSYPELFRIVLRDRNAAWGPRIDAALEANEPTFFAIGTLHLVGPDNVLSFLRDDVRRL